MRHAIQFVVFSTAIVLIMAGKGAGQGQAERDDPKTPAIEMPSPGPRTLAATSPEAALSRLLSLTDELGPRGKSGGNADGVQLRLRSDKTSWSAAEIPVFRTELRNGGSRTHLAVLWGMGALQLDVDGKWHKAPFLLGSPYKAFEPGAVMDTLVTLSPVWFEMNENDLGYTNGNEDALESCGGDGQSACWSALGSGPNSKRRPCGCSKWPDDEPRPC
jgi:hypothetical protein